jgi:hypothetical protein
MDILKQLKETEVSSIYEIIFEDDNHGSREELTLSGIKKLNLAGYTYTGSQTDIDFEDLDENGKTVVRYMDIHYFAKINIEEVNEKMNEFFPDF